MKSLILLSTILFSFNAFCMESNNSKEINNNNSVPTQEQIKWQKKEAPLSFAASCIVSIIENLDQYDIEELKKAKYPEEIIELFVILKKELSNNDNLSPEQQIKKLDAQAIFFANNTVLIEALAYLANKFDEKLNNKRNAFILNFVDGWLKNNPDQIKESYIKDLCGMAASAGNLKALKILANYVDLNEKLISNWTCLSLAASKNNLPMIQYLISKGFNKDSINAFREAIGDGHIDIVKYFYENNLVPKIKDWQALTLDWETDWCPLATAADARKNRLELVKYFIKEGANPNGFCRSTPLSEACSKFFQYPMDEKIKVIEYLLNAGADLYQNKELLYNLVMNDQEELLEFLLPRGLDKLVNEPILANPNLPLCRACSQANLKTVKLLLEHGTKINLKDKDKKTALYYAIRSLKKLGIYVADMLIAKGATIELSQVFGPLEDMAKGWLTVINLDIFAYVIKLAEKLEGLESTKLRIKALADQAFKSEKNELAQYLYDLLNSNDINEVLKSYNQKWILDNFFSDKP